MELLRRREATGMSREEVARQLEWSTSTIFRIETCGAIPSGDAPSTWILKPDGPHATAANEATCLRLAAACALPVPEAELLDVAGLPVLVVKRYDRQDAPAGGIPVRVHQEDGCQATATPPGLKYEEQGGPATRTRRRRPGIGPWSSSPTWMFTSSTQCARATPATITRIDPWRS
jgi:HipA-like C-terminal domain/Helix-turn-helix domain